MASSKALVLTNKSTDIGQARHSSFTHFLDLIDACGFDLSVGRTRPELDSLSVYKVIFIDYAFAPIKELLALDVFYSLYKNRIVLFGVNDNTDKVEADALKLGVRGVFYEHDKLENMIKGIQQIKNVNASNLKNAYLGALTMKSSQFESSPKEKVAVFKEGKELLESSISKESKNGEFRFLRLAMQEKSPKVLRYNSNIEEDKKVLLETFGDLDFMVKKVIKKYAEESVIISPSELK